ncbi:DUF2634 domain-containing protein [Brevibacillus laterosporus]|nr:DUF2634 domain-containing protein [Brevibacillus laterosporus]ATO52074.1 hypothetical protein BrL25_14325 [Brevibacillus laterosporus DSM 25]MED2005506.1 DUF2634 domain-containing protein [Brevibacillus laterosporus]
MLPQGSTIDSVTLEEVEQPSKTYKLDLVNKRIVGFVDGLDAVKQAVFKILSTIRFEYLIYSHDYGFESQSMEDEAIFRSEIQRCVREALLQDDRILDVTDFKITIEGDTSLTEFVVVSKYGDFKETKQVAR